MDYVYIQIQFKSRYFLPLCDSRVRVTTGTVDSSWSRAQDSRALGRFQASRKQLSTHAWPGFCHVWESLAKEHCPWYGRGWRLWGDWGRGNWREAWCGNLQNEHTWESCREGGLCALNGVPLNGGQEWGTVNVRGPHFVIPLHQSVNAELWCLLKRHFLVSASPKVTVNTHAAIRKFLWWSLLLEE